MAKGEPVPVEHGVQHSTLSGEEVSVVRLMRAAANLYFAAHWTPDRPCDADALWTELRDAAGLEPGHSPKPLT